MNETEREMREYRDDEPGEPWEPTQAEIDAMTDEAVAMRRPPKPDDVATGDDEFPW